MRHMVLNRQQRNSFTASYVIIDGDKGAGITISVVVLIREPAPGS